MTNRIYLGDIAIGGGAPVSVQTMLTCDTRNIKSTLAQINSVYKLGAEIVRLAVLDEKAAEALREIVPQSPVPLVADIHFDWRLALKAIEAGIKGLRLNPGNIGPPKKVRHIAEKAGAEGVVIRVGVNGGSLEKKILAKHQGQANAHALVESALGQVAILEETGFSNIKVSLKSSSVMETIKAVRLWGQKSPYPQHLGITEAGDILSGTVKSSVGLGISLAEGLGDTMRVSLTAPPEEEVKVAWEILRALGLRSRGLEIISCPTCGRTEGPVLEISAEIKKRFAHIEKPLKVAVMGCVVNGPGEAKEAHIGVALGRQNGLIFIKGKISEKVPIERVIDLLEENIKKML
ncbi:MAG: flavodoxin-dependent (E)-4-hydroxy-3-methylbut-2-enyl-diphosphate synthase [Candidatus Adiutrix sp.]